MEENHFTWSKFTFYSYLQIIYSYLLFTFQSLIFISPLSSLYPYPCFPVHFLNLGFKIVGNLVFNNSLLLFLIMSLYVIVFNVSALFSFLLILWLFVNPFFFLKSFAYFLFLDLILDWPYYIDSVIYSTFILNIINLLFIFCDLFLLDSLFLYLS